METLVLYGDTSKTLAGKTEGGDDTLGGNDGAYNTIYGDAWRLAGQATGGDDNITGGSDDAINWLYGDAYNMQGLAIGGNDIIIGGMNAQNYLYGDAYAMTGTTGGCDTLSVADNLAVTMNNISSAAQTYSDAYDDTYGTVTIGTTLTLTVSGNNQFGDTQTMLAGMGGSDILSVADNWDVTMNNNAAYAIAFAYADSTATSTIGSTLSLNLSDNNLYGDAQTMSGGKGGSDILSVANNWDVTMDNAGATATAFADTSGTAIAKIGSTLSFTLSDNNLFGDAQTIVGGTGGADILSVADNWAVTMNNPNPTVNVIADSSYGNPSATATIGSTVTLNLSDNHLFGDAYSMTNSTGGNDTLSIGTGWVTAVGTTGVGSNLITNITDNTLVGDAYTMTNSKGGNDTLSGADFAGSTTYLTGDGIYAISTSKGGNDTLISGKGNDFMWGDFGGKDNTSPPTGVTFGKDTFVFQANNGQDIIYDFHRGDGDQIKLLEIAGVNASTIAGKIGLSVDGHNNIINLNDGNTITVVGVSDLTVGDFIFA